MLVLLLNNSSVTSRIAVTWNVVVHGTKFLLYIASEFSVTWAHLSQLRSVCGTHQIQPIIAVLTMRTSDLVYGILNMLQIKRYGVYV